MKPGVSTSISGDVGFCFGTIVPGVDGRKKFSVVLDETGEAMEHLTSLRGGKLLPRLLAKSSVCRSHSLVNIIAVSGMYGSDGMFGPSSLSATTWKNKVGKNSKAVKRRLRQDSRRIQRNDCLVT